MVLCRLRTKSLRNKWYRYEIRGKWLRAVGSKDIGLRLISRKSGFVLYLSPWDKILQVVSGSTDNLCFFTQRWLILSEVMCLFTELHHFNSCLALRTSPWTLTGLDRVLSPTQQALPSAEHMFCCSATTRIHYEVYKMPCTQSIIWGFAVLSGR